jgi:hypothetical protein
MAKKKEVGRIKGSDSVHSMYYEPFLNPRQTSRTRTEIIGMMLERRLYEIAMGRFKWEGLPEEIDIRWMEMALQDNALAVFFKDTNDGVQPRTGKYLAMRGTGTGNMNMLGNPTEFMVWGNGVYGSRRLTIDECVPIWANKTRIPDGDIIRIYATRLADLDRTIEINLKNARQSKVIAHGQNSGLSATEINRQLEAGSNSVTVNDNFDISTMIAVLDLGIHPDQVLNLSQVRARIWGEAMEMLGINQNPGQDKKERLVAAEVAGNDNIIESIRETNLAERKAACLKINKMFGLNVTVEYATHHETGVPKASSALEPSDGTEGA